MGVSYDYYRAANRQAAADEPDSPRAVEKPMPGVPAFDAVDAKGIDPGVILGQLVALVRDVPYSLDLVRTVTVYPPPEDAPATTEEWEALPEDSPYKEGPGIEELPADVRDTLAGIPDGRLDELAERWERIEEFADVPPAGGYLREVITGLRGLAQRAQQEDQMPLLLDLRLGSLPVPGASSRCLSQRLRCDMGKEREPGGCGAGRRPSGLVVGYALVNGQGRWQGPIPSPVHLGALGLLGGCRGQ
ncbi:hypothetical protein [Nonomuraea candida]|uniref:hypothetical protein n=1 Tax=Nonomuraea candida TaxID=359159 RepID=UPI0006933CA1|nr:hypothetical protein [Nonomuraea candida]